MSDKSSLKELCFKIPKAELHIHLEGTIEPEMMLNIQTNLKQPKNVSLIHSLKSNNEFNYYIYLILKNLS